MAKLLTTGSEGIQDYLERYPAYAETNSWSWCGGNLAQETLKTYAKNIFIIQDRAA